MADAVAQSKVLLKIVMPSAPTVSFAPYASQTIGLTTWDQDITVGGITYLSGFIVDIPEQTNSADFSRGQGGFALGPEGSLTLADVCAGGRLKPFVDSGEIPLIGAQVFALDATGAIAPVSYLLQELAEDGANLSFSLKSPAYINSKPLSFSALLSGGSVSIGVSVGDAEVQGINAAGHYKGVSVPTVSNSSVQNIVGTSLSEWNFGNPAEPINMVERTHIVSASEKITTTVVSDTVSDEDGLRDFWKNARETFVFNFENQQELDDFWNQYIGLYENGWVPLQPNQTLIISDGTNSEILIRRDDSGMPVLGKYGAPIVGTDPESLPSRSVAVRQTVDHMQFGTVQAYKGNPNIYQEWIVINEPLLFAKNYALRPFAGKNVPSFFVAPIVGGSLLSSDPENITLYVLDTLFPICSGADSVVGFNKEKTVTVVPGRGEKNELGILLFSPTLSNIDGFEAWKDVDISKRIALNGYALGGTDFNALFHGKIISSVGDDGSYFEQKIVCGASSGGDGAVRYIQYSWRAKIDENIIGFTPDYLFVDPEINLSLVINGDYTYADAMVPFITDNSQYRVKNSECPIYRMGTGVNLPSHKFDSIKTLNESGLCQMRVYAQSSDLERSASEIFASLHIYAVSKLSFGNNPAVVVPGNFPGTSNPTTTPALAIDQLAAWLGLTVKPTGGITPSSSAWGEYLGPDPTSTDAYTTAGKETLADLMKEAWIFGAETTAAATAPLIEKVEHPVVSVGSIDDVVTLPQITYDYAGNSAQYTAKILNVDQEFDISKGDGFFWGGWQEKDTCHLSASPGSAVLAMCQLEDCLAVVCADGYLRCSYDGGTTWPFSRLLYSSPTHGVAISGGGIMIASTGGNGATVVSFDAGRTWEPINIQLAIFWGGWFDETTGRFWLCGAAGGQYRAVWHSVDGITWTEIISAAEGGFVDILAVGDDIFATAQISGAWAVLRNTISGGGTIWSFLQLGSHDNWTDAPHLARWNGSVRIAIGVTLWSSADLLTWTNSVTPIALISFATDRKVVSALGSEVPSATSGNRIYYSRDQGSTWKAVRVSPENTVWAQTDATASVWDDNTKCFRFAAWGPTRVIALGDPSLLDIWLQCRAAYLRTGTLHSETYDWKGLYDASEVVRWLLDCKDGIDPSQQQTRLAWMCKQARFVDLEVAFGSVVDQLSCVAGLPITIPTQRLRDAGLAAGLPAIGLISKSTHRIMDGTSSLEIIMPPV